MPSHEFLPPLAATFHWITGKWVGATVSAAARLGAFEHFAKQPKEFVHFNDAMTDLGGAPAPQCILEGLLV